jgi:hypothetical protein
MDNRAQAFFADFESSDRDTACRAIVGLFEMTQSPVKWAYEVRDQLVNELKHRDGHKRVFAAQLLARLAISNPELNCRTACCLGR